MKQKRFTTRMLVLLGLLTALEIVLSRFCSISAWNMKIGFSFVPIAIGAMLYGALGGAIVGALGDFIGAILFPIGAYFPGFTLTAALTGAVFGLFLYRKRNSLRILGAVAINQLLLSFLLNTLWISVLYGSPFGALLVTRAVQVAVLAPIQFLVLSVLVKGSYWKELKR